MRNAISERTSIIFSKCSVGDDDDSITTIIAIRAFPKFILYFRLPPIHSSYCRWNLPPSSFFVSICKDREHFNWNMASHARPCAHNAFISVFFWSFFLLWKKKYTTKSVSERLKQHQPCHQEHLNACVFPSKVWHNEMKCITKYVDGSVS